MRVLIALAMCAALAANYAVGASEARDASAAPHDASVAPCNASVALPNAEVESLVDKLLVAPQPVPESTPAPATDPSPTDIAESVEDTSPKDLEQSDQFRAELASILKAPSLSPPKAKTTTPRDSSKPLILTGKLVHSGRVQPLDRSLHPGQRFDRNRLKQISADNIWGRVPAWMTGTWLYKKQTVFFVEDYRTGARDNPVETTIAKAGETHGHQRDAEGGYWHFFGGKYWTVTRLKDGYAFGYTRAHHIARSSDNSVSIWFSWISVVVDDDMTILKSCQKESINTYTLHPSGLKKCVSSNKVFDEHGLPVLLHKNLRLAERVEPYERVDVAQNRNLRALFKEYLLNHGLARLVPN